MITADWVKNARAAQWGVLRYGRKTVKVALIELPEAERAPILRAFPKLIPHGVQYFQRIYGLPAHPALLPDAFAGLASRSTVFEVNPLPANQS